MPSSPVGLELVDTLLSSEVDANKCFHNVMQSNADSQLETGFADQNHSSYHYYFVLVGLFCTIPLWFPTLYFHLIKWKWSESRVAYLSVYLARSWLLYSFKTKSCSSFSLCGNNKATKLSFSICLFTYGIVPDVSHDKRENSGKILQFDFMGPFHFI